MGRAQLDPRPNPATGNTVTQILPGFLPGEHQTVTFFNLGAHLLLVGTDLKIEVIA